jgi:hypothetical protein
MIASGIATARLQHLIAKLESSLGALPDMCVSDHIRKIE